MEMMEMEKESIEKFEEIKSKFENNGFGINRVPKKTKDWFFQFAEEEFETDRGMALKHLVDFYVGVLGTGTEAIELVVKDIEERLSKLEAMQETKKSRREVFREMKGEQ
jgi:hypothetical protein